MGKIFHMIMIFIHLFVYNNKNKNLTCYDKEKSCIHSYIYNHGNDKKK